MDHVPDCCPTAGELVVDFKRAAATWRGEEYKLSPVGPAAQELVLAGGLEALTRDRLKT